MQGCKEMTAAKYREMTFLWMATVQKGLFCCSCCYDGEESLDVLTYGVPLSGTLNVFFMLRFQCLLTRDMYVQSGYHNNSEE
jgi:hypothetical protein